MARATISLVSVQKPIANTPVLQRRNKFTSSIDQQITKIGLFREGKRISREQFWVDANGGISFRLRYGKQPLELEKGKSTLKASTFDVVGFCLDNNPTDAVDQQRHTDQRLGYLHGVIVKDFPIEPPR